VTQAHGAVLMFCLATIGGAASRASAEPVEILGSIGLYRAFLDEPAELAGSIAVRVPITRRLAIRPEFIASSYTDYLHTSIVGSATFDVTNPDRAVVAFVSGGGGWLRTHDKRINYSYDEGVGLAGVGVRFVVGKIWTAGSEFRLGTNAFPLLTFSVGIRLGR
jgi:hypothetical protein